MTSSPFGRYPLTGTVDVVVVGAGHAGLAMSHRLSRLAIEHVVLERGEIANSWRHERWNSLRLLTPNWQSRLPDYSYEGADPDGFMTMPEVIGFITAYAKRIAAPVRTGVTVTSVMTSDDGYRVETDRGAWRCRAVVLASGAHGLPNLPAFAAAVPDSLKSLTAKDYRHPGQLDDRGVLVVGASATGLQLADEIARSGRPVTLCVGEHIRMLRTYRGLDIQRWLDVLGILDERYDAVDDIVRVRRVPSPQLIGSPDRATLDLNALTERGVTLVGRLVGIHDGKAQFSGSLATIARWPISSSAVCSDSIDAGWRSMDTVRRAARGVWPVQSAEQFAPTRVAAQPPLTLDLTDGRIGTVLWATGFRPGLSAGCTCRCLIARGACVTTAASSTRRALCARLNFMRRRKSSFIHGAEDDVRELGEHLAAFLRIGVERPARRAAG